MMLYRQMKERAKKSLVGALDMAHEYAYLAGFFARFDERRGRRLTNCALLVECAIDKKYGSL